MSTYGQLGHDVPGRVKTPPEPGSESAGPAVTELVAEVQRTRQALHALYLRDSRMWSNYRETASDSSAAAGFTFTLPRLNLGFEAEVERITLSVTGASAAATAQVYRNGAQESSLLYTVAALVGNTPSRVVIDLNQPIRLAGDECLVIVIASAAGTAGSSYARAEGRKREL